MPYFHINFIKTCIDLIYTNNIFNNLCNKSCLIIGNNLSVLDFKYDNYIDNFNGSVIRINPHNNLEYVRNIGSRINYFR